MMLLLIYYFLLFFVRSHWQWHHRGAVDLFGTVSSEADGSSAQRLTFGTEIPMRCSPAWSDLSLGYKGCTIFWGGSWALLGNNQFFLYLGIIGENNKQFTEPISPKLRFHFPSLISEWCRAWAKQTCILITPAWLFKQHVQHDPTYQWGQGKQPPQHKSPAASDLHS